MKILFVLEHFHPYIGGAEKIFFLLTTGLAERGYEVTVVTTRYDKKLPHSEILQDVKIIRVDCWNRFGFTFFSFLTILKHAKQADVIHTTTYNAALPAVIASKLTGKPIFVTFHEVWGQLWKTLPFTGFFEKYGYYFFEKMLLKLPFTKFIAVSNFTKNELIKHGISPEKIVRIYNGIDYKQFEKYDPSPPPTFTYTYFGRLGISKGLDLLIPAAAEFRKKYPDSTLKMIIPKQPKPLYRKVLDLIDKYQLGDYIEFKHNLPREELYQELLTSSCIVISSYSEGFCFAAAETVALRVPIISSNKGALSEVVSGKFIRLEDMTVVALAKALKRAYQNIWIDSSLRFFHLSETRNEYLELYEKLHQSINLND